MKRKDWIGLHVKVKSDTTERVGQVIERWKFRTWWRIRFPDGSIKLYPERQLEIVPPPAP